MSDESDAPHVQSESHRVTRGCTVDVFALLNSNGVFNHLGEPRCCHVLLCHQEVIDEQEAGCQPSSCLPADLSPPRSFHFLRSVLFSVALSLSPHADSDVWAAASQEEIKKREGNRMFSPMESLYFDLWPPAMSQNSNDLRTQHTPRLDSSSGSSERFWSHQTSTYSLLASQFYANQAEPLRL